MDKLKILNLVAFCVLMENDKGILNKSPDYIMEKYNRYVLSTREDEFNWGLDAHNKRKLAMWATKWEWEGKEECINKEKE